MTRESIQFIINEWDPMRIIYYDEIGDQGTCNYDEYDPEVDIICKCLALCGENCPIERLSEILRVVFANFFDKERFLWTVKPRNDAKTFGQVAEEILHDDTAVGTSVFDVEPNFYVDEVHNRIISQLFDEKTHTELVRYVENRKAAIARLEILRKIYREEDFDTNLPLTFRSLVEMFFGHHERGREFTEKILAAYKTPEEILQNGLENLRNLLKSCKNSRPFAKNFFAMLEILLDNHGGKLPETFSELFEVPNLGEGTIYLIRHEVIRNSDVDYQKHVLRVANRTKIAEESTFSEVLRSLRAISEMWYDVEHKLFFHGQKICADEPKCSICPMLSCPSRC